MSLSIHRYWMARFTLPLTLVLFNAVSTLAAADTSPSQGCVAACHHQAQRTFRVSARSPEKIWLAHFRKYSGRFEACMSQCASTVPGRIAQ
jgi:hypothetical protein